jgi:NADH-quinone oxidoreductase subunit L
MVIMDIHHEKPYAWVLSFCCPVLGLLGFPITPTFIGVDLLFSHIHENTVCIDRIYFHQFCFYRIIRAQDYARVFMGQHKKAHHAIAYRSS